jgi:hypothetical protein
MKVAQTRLAWLFAAMVAWPAYAGEDEIPVDDGEPVQGEGAQVAPEAEATAEASVAAEAAAAQANAPEASASAPNPTDPKKPNYDFIAEAGKRVEIREGDFSLQPPVGWEVYVNLPSLSLLMQVPHTPGERYQRTIQVASFSGPRYIDEVTAKEYEDVIVRKFSTASASIVDYRMRNHMTIEMADGRQGLLFYTEFKIDDVPLMQAHILVSSADRHYLMTYSDVAEHFESEAATQFLTEAWDSMISVQLSTKTPARFESAAYIGIAAGVVVLLGLALFGFRQWRSGREYRDFANGKEAFDDKSGVSSIHSGVSLMDTTGSAVSQIQPSKAKSKKKDKAETSAQTMASRFTGEEESIHTKDDMAV